MDVTMMPITIENLDGFRPYVVASAVALWEEDPQGVILLGLVANDSTSCGAVVGVLEDDVLHIVSLYVDEAIRGQGWGRKLMDAIIQETNPATLQAHWFLPKAEHEKVSAFFAHMGFEAESISGAPVFRIDVKDLEKNLALRPALSSNFRPDPNVISFCDIMPEERQELLSDTSIEPVLRVDALEEDAIQSPLSVAYRYGGKIGGYFAAIPTEDGIAILPVVVREDCHSGAFLAMAAAVLNRALPHLSQTGCCWTQTTNEHAQNLAVWLGANQEQGWFEGTAGKDSSILG